MRHTSLHVSHKYSHGFHCTTGDIIVFQACTALTSLNLTACLKLTGKAKETSSPSSIESKLGTRTTLSLPVTVDPTITPALLCGLAVCVCVHGNLVC